jgi:hypothetical protein
MAEFDNVLRGFDEKSALILDMGQRVGNATGEHSDDTTLSEKLESDYLELDDIWSSVLDERNKFLDLVMQMGLRNQVDKSIETIVNFVVPVSRRTDHLFGLLHGIGLVIGGWFEKNGDPNKLAQIEKKYEEMVGESGEGIGYIG